MRNLSERQTTKEKNKTFTLFYCRLLSNWSISNRIDRLHGQNISLNGEFNLSIFTQLSFCIHWSCVFSLDRLTICHCLRCRRHRWQSIRRRSNSKVLCILNQRQKHSNGRKMRHRNATTWKTQRRREREDTEKKIDWTTPKIKRKQSEVISDAWIRWKWNVHVGTWAKLWESQSKHNGSGVYMFLFFFS